MRKKKANKKKPYLIAIGIFLLVVLGSGYYFLIYNNDTQLLKRAERQFEKVDDMITTDESKDDVITEEIGDDVSNDENDLDELEATFDSIFNNLDSIENAETEIGNSVE
jgi:hypothetical protein